MVISTPVETRADGATPEKVLGLQSSPGQVQSKVSHADFIGRYYLKCSLPLGCLHTQNAQAPVFIELPAEAGPEKDWIGYGFSRQGVSSYSNSPGEKRIETPKMMLALT